MVDHTAQHPQLVRVGAVQGLEEALLQFGCTADQLFAESGLDRGMLSDGDHLISIRDIGHLLERAVDLTQCPRLPLHLAEQQDLSYLGTFGLLLKTSATVGEVLREVQDYQKVHIQSSNWSLVTSKRIALLNFWLDVPGMNPVQQRLIIELALAQAFKLVEAVSGSSASIDRVCFRFDYPRGRQEYRRFFRAPIEFNAEVSGLQFPIGLLDLPVSPSDAALHQLVLREIAGEDLSGAPQDLADEVRRIIRTLLPTGQCSVERVARYFACDKRSLQRYLREESDTTYQVLLDEVRFDLVQHYLRNSNMPMTQLAYVAGYTDTSNFARAFRQHFGVTPRSWREQHGDCKQTRRRHPLGRIHPARH